MSGRGSILRLINCFVLSAVDWSGVELPPGLLHQVRPDQNIMMWESDSLFYHFISEIEKYLARPIISRQFAALKYAIGTVRSCWIGPVTSDSSDDTYLCVRKTFIRPLIEKKEYFSWLILIRSGQRTLNRPKQQADHFGCIDWKLSAHLVRTLWG